ncbi:hypothetical protein AV530_009566 [Patagioenas fasciata monilis]|uniref:Uncharacterized protein n=1 Tax=Patagioenas fasciata monilis TaxID=372326 RepID=A0A1V4KS10_PATFA|nr:hypothetical protein AV530_009566 [Patagioenas fasciata monilis]
MPVPPTHGRILPTPPVPLPGIRGLGQVPRASAAAAGTGLFLSTLCPATLSHPGELGQGQSRNMDGD